ncbi:MAG: hypothetical protein U5K84_03280 [Alkalibacterium sp.]|nr:hypothetical protein [Alkalibacterium sp.]
MENGQVFDTYSGQVDLLPTLLHLTGIETDEFLFMGQDLLSGNHNNTVPLRNGRVMTPEYSFLGQSIYDNEGNDITADLTEEELAELLSLKEEARKELTHSDNIMMMDLLRFYSPSSIKEFVPNDYIYSNQLDILEEKALKSNSLLKQRDG